MPNEYLIKWKIVIFNMCVDDWNIDLTGQKKETYYYLNVSSRMYQPISLNFKAQISWSQSYTDTNIQFKYRPAKLFWIPDKWLYPVFLCTGRELEWLVYYIWHKLTIWIPNHLKSQLQKVWYSNVPAIQMGGIQIPTVHLNSVLQKWVPSPPNK